MNKEKVLQVIEDGAETPFYFYDLGLLSETLNAIKEEAAKYEGFKVHYAVKANSNPVLLRMISGAGFGADIVSGGELNISLENGFLPEGIVYSGVGKTDKELMHAIEAGIGAVNLESIPELEIISELAGKIGKTANVNLRINPNVGAHTHAHITTGLAENKFGIALHQLDEVVDKVLATPNVKLRGLHFHIGSQILDMADYEALCHRINEMQRHLLAKRGITLEMIDVGGGLGIDYDDPDKNPVPDFASYFATFGKYLKLYPGQTLHFELGRAVVGQCGTLVGSVIFVKEATAKKFVIIDAGMNDLIRPALYDAHHKIENLTSELPEEKYDVVGPICESADVFGKDVLLPETHRGDVIAIRSAGAYGEVMSSHYNLRPAAGFVYSDYTP